MPRIAVDGFTVRFGYSCLVGPFCRLCGACSGVELAGRFPRRGCVNLRLRFEVGGWVRILSTLDIFRTLYCCLDSLLVYPKFALVFAPRLPRILSHIIPNHLIRRRNTLLSTHPPNSRRTSAAPPRMIPIPQNRIRPQRLRNQRPLLLTRQMPTIHIQGTLSGTTPPRPHMPRNTSPVTRINRARE